MNKKLAALFTVIVSAVLLSLCCTSSSPTDPSIDASLDAKHDSTIIDSSIDNMVMGMIIGPGKCPVFDPRCTTQIDSSTDAGSEAEAGPESGAEAGIDAGAEAGDSGGSETGSIVDPSRIVVWNPGLNSIGGIPTRNTIFTTVNPSGGDDTSAIQTAVNNCPANQVVLLAAGDFHINSGPVIAQYDPNGSVNKSNITIRGSGIPTDAGVGGTRIFMPTATNAGPAFEIGTDGSGEAYYTSPESLTADATIGSTSVTVSSNPGYAVGELVAINQLLDPNVSWFAPGHGNGGLFNLTNRPIGQVLEIQSISGTTLTFSTALHQSYFVSQTAQISRYWKGFGAANSNPLTMSGIENMYINGGAGGLGAIALLRCKYCWVQNVEIDNFIGAAIDMQGTFRALLRDSYIHSTQNPDPGGGGYATSISWYGADNLQENNISWNVNKVEVARSSGGGNVWGYNYYQDGFGAGYPTIPEVGMNASHYPTPHMELFEGNEAWDFESDVVWGNAIDITVFRNHMTGRRRNVSPPFAPAANLISGISFTVNASANTFTRASGSFISDSYTLGEYLLTNNFSNGNNNNLFIITNVTASTLTVTPLNPSQSGPLVNETSSGANLSLMALLDNSIRHTAGAGIFSTGFNFIGNFLGTTGDTLLPQTSMLYEKDAGNMCDTTIYAMFMLGWGDTMGNCGIVNPGFGNTLATEYLHGNYNVATNTTVWDPSNSFHTLPNSFYLSSKPAFFGSNPWPWVDPITPAVNTLPARARFSLIHGLPY